jgi:riboflavin kinase/FMN adenylyltransferase
MTITWSRQLESLGRAIIAMGVFDGVHQGHQFLLRQAASDAQRQELPLWAVTFTIDPDELFRPAESLNKLMTNAVRLQSLADTAVAGVLAIPFGREVADLTPEEFLDSILAHAFTAATVHVGEDFRFGARATGDVQQMRQWGKQHGCGVVAHRLLQDHGKPVTATRIRALLGTGDVAAAAELLTRPYKVAAKVVQGRRAGTELGFPTINLAIDPSLATVGDGVYAGYAQASVNGKQSVFRAAISVGVPQTFGDLPNTTEAFLLDFPANAKLYGAEVQLSFVHRLRDMMRFNSPEELAATIAANVAWIEARLPPLASLMPPLPRDSLGIYSRIR